MLHYGIETTSRRHYVAELTHEWMEYRILQQIDIFLAKIIIIVEKYKLLENPGIKPSAT